MPQCTLKLTGAVRASTHRVVQPRADPWRVLAAERPQVGASVALECGGHVALDVPEKVSVYCDVAGPPWRSPYAVVTTSWPQPFEVTRVPWFEKLAALDGSLNDAAFRKDETFGFMVPTALDGVDATILNPRETWSDKTAYDAQAEKLAEMFIENFKVYEAHVDAAVNAAGPRLKVDA